MVTSIFIQCLNGLPNDGFERQQSNEHADYIPFPSTVFFHLEDALRPGFVQLVSCNALLRKSKEKDRCTRSIEYWSQKKKMQACQSLKTKKVTRSPRPVINRSNHSNSKRVRIISSHVQSQVANAPRITQLVTLVNGYLEYHRRRSSRRTLSSRSVATRFVSQIEINSANNRRLDVVLILVTLAVSVESLLRGG